MTETVPTVIFDIELGKQIDFIDFDYQEFADMANNADMSEQEVENFTVHFSSEDAVNGAGRYIHRKRTAKVYVPSVMRHSELNSFEISDELSKTVSHETGHYIDHLKFTGDKTFRDFYLRKYLILGSVAAGIGMSIAEHNPLYAVGGIAPFIGVVAHDAIQYPLPHMRPTEKFAYSFEWDNENRHLVTASSADRATT